MSCGQGPRSMSSYQLLVLSLRAKERKQSEKGDEREQKRMRGSGEQEHGSRTTAAPNCDPDRLGTNPPRIPFRSFVN